MLYEFVMAHRDQIITRCRQRGATRPSTTHAVAEPDYGVPLFLEQLVNTLQSKGQPNLAISTSAALHGHDLLVKGFTVSQVVHDYGDVCQTITELALETNAPIDTEDFRTLNRCLDEAIAGAVTVYGRESEQSSLDGQAERGNQRMGFFVHELRNLVNTAVIAFRVLQTGNVGVGVCTALVRIRSLTSLQDLIARSLDEVRLSAGIQDREETSVAEFVAAL